MGNLLPSVKEEMTIRMKDADERGLLVNRRFTHREQSAQGNRTACPSCFIAHLVMDGPEDIPDDKEPDEHAEGLMDRTDAWLSDHGISQNAGMCSYIFEEYADIMPPLEAAMKTIEWLDGNEENPCK